MPNEIQIGKNSNIKFKSKIERSSINNKILKNKKRTTKSLFMYILIKRHLFYSTFTWTFQFFFLLFIFHFFFAGRAQKTWPTDWRKTRAKPKYHYQKNSTIMYACVCILSIFVCV